LELNDGYEHTLTFSDEATPAGGSDAQDVSVRFSSAKSTSFTYNESHNAYYMRQHNRDFLDANNNASVPFTNLIILKTRVGALTGPDAGAGRRDILTTGTGTGYFVHGGKYIEIDWSRADKHAQFKYSLKNGTELELGRGRTYIGIIPTDMSVTFNP
jgi:hypothetical protein